MDTRCECVFVFLCVLIVIVYCHEDIYSVSHTSETFNADVPKSKHFVMFFAPWCGHCKRLSPTWEDLAKLFNKELEKSQVIIAKVDCTLETALCAEHGITGYPTLLYFKSGIRSSVRYKGTRDMSSLQSFIEDQLTEAEALKQQEAKRVKSEGPLVELTDETFEDTVMQGYTFVEFFAPWCGHCKRLAPIWEELAEAFADDDSITIAKVDCTRYRPMCVTYGITAYPTLQFYKDGEMEAFNDVHDLEHFKSFIIRKMGEDNEQADSLEGAVPDSPLKDDRPVPAVFTLDEETFDPVIADGITFVKFFAPWCGHCKKLAPTWNELSVVFAGSSNIRIAKVDCTEQTVLCKRFAVRGYPTLLIFRDGDMLEEYNGQRDVNSLAAFVNKHQPHEEL